MTSFKALALTALLALVNQGAAELRGFNGLNSAKENAVNALTELETSLSEVNQLIEQFDARKKDADERLEAMTEKVVTVSVDESDESSDEVSGYKPSDEDIYEGIKFLNDKIDGMDRPLEELESALAYLGDIVGNMDGPLKEKIEQALVLTGSKYEGKKQSFEDERLYEESSDSMDDTPSTENIAAAMTFLNEAVEDPEGKDLSYYEIEDGFAYVGDTIQKLPDGKEKDELDNSLEAMHQTFEEKKATAIEEDPEEEESGDSMDDVSAENILEALKYLNEVVEDPERKEASYSEIEDGFKYVGKYIEKLDGGVVKDKFEDTLAVMHMNFYNGKQ